jgi:hypothetical protein
MLSIAEYFKLLPILQSLAFAFIFFTNQAADYIKEIDIPRSIERTRPALTITIGPNYLMRKDFEDIKTYTENLLTEGVQPKSILLILDVDGTITNYSRPDESPSPKSIEARGESVSFY